MNFEELGQGEGDDPFEDDLMDELPPPPRRGALGEYLCGGTKAVRMVRWAIVALALLLVVALCVVSVVVVFFSEGSPIDQTTTHDATTTEPETTTKTTTFVYEDEDDYYRGYRLPTDVRPLAYRLTLGPDLEHFTFGGEEEIDIEVLNATDVIVLNSVDLHISSCSLDDHVVENEYILYEDNTEHVSFRFPDPLEPGTYTLKIQFSGNLRDDMRGFYRSKYTLPDDDEEHWMATTQFESTDARAAFPCFDEPAFKATFQMTLKVPADLVALSNMDEVSSERDGQLKVVTFGTTPRMSTYLLAFVVGDFKYVGGEYGSIRVRCYAVRGKESQGTLAVEVAIHVLQWYEEAFGRAYELPKLDMIAIPDFSAGAMENWGLVTYRETALLLNPTEDSAGNKQRVGLVVAHELCHQWAGDLVTMEWWSDLFLNEGFATYFEWESLLSFFPDWHVRDQFLVDDQQRAFEIDSLQSTHPIHVEVSSGEEISEIFDGISYSKAGSVLRMINSALGETAWLSGLRSYFHDRALNTSTPHDLFTALSAASGLDTEAMFLPWIMQPGFPLVEVERESADSKTITLKQSRFFLHATNSDDTLWTVPVTVLTERGEVETFSLTEREQSFSLRKKSAWLKVNVNQTGFYRVKYSAELQAALKSAWEQGELVQTGDRAGVVNDALVLARTERQPTPSALSFVSLLHEERSYTVWASVLSELARIDQLLATERCADTFSQFMSNTVSSAYADLSWAEKRHEEHTTTLLRSKILHAAVHYDMPDAVNVALDRFWSFLNGTQELPGDLRSTVYYAGIKHGGEKAYSQLYDLYVNTTNSADKARILFALGATPIVHLMQHTLEMSVNSSIVRPQDLATGFAGVSANPLGRDLSWTFLRDHFDELNVAGFGVTRLIRYVTAPFSDETHRADIANFFEENVPNGGERTVTQALEQIDGNIRWLNTNSDTVCSWLEENVAMP